MAERFVTYNTEDAAAGRIDVDERGIMRPDPPINPNRLPEGYPYKEVSEELTEVYNGELTTDSSFIDTDYRHANLKSEDGNRYLTGGAEYTIIFNGKEYKSVAYSPDPISTSLGGFDEGYPFEQHVDRMDNMSELYWLPSEGDTVTYALHKKETVETIHPISTEYLLTEEWVFTLDDDSTVTKKVVVGE